MDDVLGWGADREPRRWLFSLAAIAVILMLVVVAFRHIPQHRPSTAHRAATAVTAGPVQLAGLGSTAARLLDRTRGVGVLASRQHQMQSITGSARSPGPRN
jgi:hypothetical protein